MYLYAITDQPEAPIPAGPGLKGASLLSLVYREIAAVVSPLAAAGVQATEVNIRRHEAVVEALMADRAVLPVRFGAVLEDEPAVQAALAAHYAGFVADLDRVRGRVEIGLRVLWNEEEQASRRAGQQGSAPPRTSAPLHTGSGRTYLMARLEQERRVQAERERAEELAAELHTPLARLAAESTHQLLVTPRMLLTAAYLVERNQMAAFQQEVEALGVVYPALHFLCTGPWPPHSFVTAGTPSPRRNSVHV